MGDMGEVFREMREAGKKKRASNRESSAQQLINHGIKFTSHNCAAHLIVEGKDGLIDFWPGTGKFIIRGGRKGRGVFNLIKAVRGGG